MPVVCVGCRDESNTNCMQQVIDFFVKLFDTSDWPPGWHYGQWTDFHGWLYIISDLLVWSAFFAIPLIILRYISKKHDTRFVRLYFLFAGFILACGTTYFFDAVAFWFPVYRLNALLRLITGVLSWITVFSLVRFLPLAFSLRSSRELEAEVEQRKQAEEKFRDLLGAVELKLHQRTIELERKNMELEQFAYVASHDMQEPLKTATGFVELFRRQYRDKLDDNAEKYLDYVTQSNERMHLLIRDLLDYNRLGGYGQPAQVDCKGLLQEALVDMDQGIRESHAVINVNGLPVVTALRTELKLLFRNLISNSIKFRKPGVAPAVDIHARKENGGWTFSFRDNGIGIKQIFQDRIFIIFQRLHNRSDYEGSGIGLAHCKKIVELHGGKIWVESVPGEGSTFFFTIPEISVI